MALAAALSYGIGDFLAGVGGRRSLPALIPLIIQATGVVFAGVAVLLLAHGSPTAGALVWGALSGIGSGLGNWALVRGLALGQMSVVAPVSAVLTAALPVLVGVMLGEHLSGSAWTGIALAGPAIALVSQSGPISGFAWSDLAYGAVAGLGFSLLFIALDRAGTDAGAWPLLPG